MSEAVQLRPPALPATTQELLSLHKSTRTLNDHVQTIVEVLWDDAQFRRLLDAVSHSAAVEGSLRTDDTMASMMIRNMAREEGRYHDDYVASQNLFTLARALNFVLRRFKLSRKQRARMIGGEIVEDDHDSDTEED